jgi:hypothetical protein
LPSALNPSRICRAARNKPLQRIARRRRRPGKLLREQYREPADATEQVAGLHWFAEIALVKAGRLDSLCDHQPG